jgi:hypothetical protein
MFQMSTPAQHFPAAHKADSSGSNAEVETSPSQELLREELEGVTSQALPSEVELISEASAKPSEPIAEHNEFDHPAKAEPDTEIEELALVDDPRPSEALIGQHLSDLGDASIGGKPIIWRSDVPKAAEGNPSGRSPRLRETPEPAVEVNIGRVEVKLDVPAPPAPKPISAPRGFAEFEALRRYITRPWPSHR